MKNALVILVIMSLFLMLSVLLSAEEAGSLLHHDLRIVLIPEESRLSATDVMTIPPNQLPEFSFTLHKGLEPATTTSGAIITKSREGDDRAIYNTFRVRLPLGAKTLTLRYGGRIYHPLKPQEREEARGFADTPGIVSKEGVYLSGSAFWYPQVEESLIAFNMTVDTPPGWEAVSQGERVLHERRKDKIEVRWESPEPQEEIFLIAAKFTEYTGTSGRITSMAFLREPDSGLAAKYLQATGKYIDMYEKLIGQYPYKKFALVENFWETGFGMPSFTLLGPKVIRLPFILGTSYPHEILHNWWGNSVYPLYEAGNWSEGLTAYLSDHLMKEQQQMGAEYRQTTLQKFTDYVKSSRDFPLTEFRSRHSASSEAIGYGKSLMLFHMLRLNLGDKTFTAGLQDFYTKFRGRRAIFDDLRRSFEAVSGKRLEAFFEQWITRKGAPELRLSDVKTTRGNNEYLLTAKIEQIQPEEAWLLNIPIAVTLEGEKRAFEKVYSMDGRGMDLAIHLPSRPLRIDLDPEFDIFRKLDRNEIPPALSEALGSEKMLIITPSSGGGIDAYREFAAALGRSGPEKVEMKSDSEISKLPGDGAVVILGWENRFLGDAASVLSAYGVTFESDKVRVDKQELGRGNLSATFTARDSGRILLFIAGDNLKALPGLARKLPHYHKYSYLGFEGDEPSIASKGRWPVIESPLTAFLPRKDGSVVKVERGEAAPREPLANLPRPFSKERMLETVRILSADDMKGRGLGTEELDRAAELIAKKFQEAGLFPGGDNGSFFQTWEDPELAKPMKNVVGILPGKRAELSGESVVIGAHYDHLGLGWPDVREGNKGRIHPGADDNASGVAVLIELAMSLARSGTDRSIIFVAFTGEEAGKRGSRHYVATGNKYPARKCIGMVNLDTVGRLGKGKLLVLGADSAAEWIHIFRGVSFVTGIDIDIVPRELDSSDQMSFQEVGVPAVQIFSGPNSDYHQPSDTFEKIDAGGLVKVALVAKETLEYLAGRKDPLTVTAKGSDAASNEKARKVSLGTIPDFAYKGAGYRLSGVVPGSPAERCGLKEGDVITKIDGHMISSVKDLSEILKNLTPGARLTITFMRDAKESTVETEVIER